MKVVFLDTTLDGSLIGGAHTFLHKILSGLADRKVEVHLVTKGKPTSRTAVNLENAGAAFHNNIWSPFALPEDAAVELTQWLEGLNPDIYVVSVSPDIGWVILPYLPEGIATIAIGHNDSDTFYAPAKHYAPFLTGAVGVSQEICRKYINNSRLNEKDVTWIPYGVESFEGKLQKNQDQPLSLVYAGRLEDEQKRSSDLIEIIKGLSKRRVSFHFDIIGDGPLVPVLKEKLSAEITNGTVKMTGWISSDQLLVKLRSSDIFLLTSNYEGFSISLVEAMANGCCAIVTNIESGNKEIVIDNKNGFIVPIGGVDQFIEKISLLNDDREKLYEMRQRALETGKDFSVDRMVEKYLDCFSVAIDQVKSKPKKKDPDFPIMESCRSIYPKWLRRLRAKAKGVKAQLKK